MSPPGAPGSAAAGSLAERLDGAPAEEREALVLALVREHVAAVLGHASAAAIDPAAPFKDLGFDSLAAVELRNRLVRATGLRLPSTLVFDHPTPAAAASFLQRAGAGARAALAAAARPAARSEEPIAIVGMGCRYPGGVASPRSSGSCSRAGATASLAFPDDRGWDLERLYDPDPDQPGTSYADEGGFLHDAAEFDAAFFGIAPREALATDPQQRLLLEAPGRRWRRPASTPRSLAGSATGVFAGVMHHDYGLGGRRPRTKGHWLAAASSPAASPTPSGWRARRSPSTPPAPPRWWRCTWRRRRCAAASATWRWPAG